MAWWRGVPDGAAWLHVLPRLAAECAQLWSLRLGTPFEGSNMSLVLPAETDDGIRTVLKLSFDARREEEALTLWDGRAAVRLLDRDRKRDALLLEACDPGTELSLIADDDEALDVAAGLLLRLWRTPPADNPFRSLANETETWAERLPDDWNALERRFERDLVDEAVAAVCELVPTQGEQVVLHGHFHSGNVLRAEREPWLAIDPLPLVGERAYDAASLLRDRRWPVSARTLARRLDVLSARLEVDRERMRRWGVIQALTWGVSATKAEEDLLMTARLLRG
jgi:streptomycin 6-kinase